MRFDGAGVQEPFAQRAAAGWICPMPLPTPRNALVILSRALSLTVCLALAACVTDAKSNEQPAVAAAPPPAKQAPPAPKGPMTEEQASIDCWMSYENGKPDPNLDRRAALVQKCIKAKMAGQPWH
jgi:hypothetical protein